MVWRADVLRAVIYRFAESCLPRHVEHALIVVVLFAHRHVTGEHRAVDAANGVELIVGNRTDTHVTANSPAEHEVTEPYCWRFAVEALVAHIAPSIRCARARIAAVQSLAYPVPSA